MSCTSLCRGHGGRQWYVRVRLRKCAVAPQRHSFLISLSLCFGLTCSEDVAPSVLCFFCNFILLREKLHSLYNSPKQAIFIQFLANSPVMNIQRASIFCKMDTMMSRIGYNYWVKPIVSDISFVTSPWSYLSVYLLEQRGGYLNSDLWKIILTVE